MFIKSVELKNFRNYKDLKLEFSQNKILLIGKNALSLCANGGN